MSLTSFETILLDCNVTAEVLVCIKKTSKLENFSAAISILKKKERSHIFDILRFSFSRKVKTQLKCKKKICAVYGEGAVPDGTCQKWFVKFHAGDFLLDDAPWS